MITGTKKKRKKNKEKKEKEQKKKKKSLPLVLAETNIIWLTKLSLFSWIQWDNLIYPDRLLRAFCPAQINKSKETWLSYLARRTTPLH